MKKTPSTSALFLLYYLPLFLWMSVIFAFSSVSGFSQGGGELTWSQWLVRKGAHIGEFSILTFLLFRVVWQYLQKKPLGAFLLTGLLAILYGLLDEIHQFYVPLRQAKMTDVMIDGVGIAVALLFFLALWMSSRRRKK